ncbi:MAG: hypothetical protein NAOJABEB_03337 [Steroidobacteraceae bacterium]|nr:hypothetical protein [Steroidobacteraceae bacterium]
MHLLISAFCFVRVSNRHTFEVLFDCDLANPKLRARHRKMITQSVLSHVEYSERLS